MKNKQLIIIVLEFSNNMKTNHQCLQDIFKEQLEGRAHFIVRCKEFHVENQFPRLKQFSASYFRGKRGLYQVKLEKFVRNMMKAYASQTIYSIPVI